MTIPSTPDPLQHEWPSGNIPDQLMSYRNELCRIEAFEIANINPCRYSAEKSGSREISHHEHASHGLLLRERCFVK
jgi:hypothetical protein